MSAFTGPVVVGYHADSSGDDALALALLLGDALGVGVTVATIYAAPVPIGIGRVDAEWVSERKRASEQALEVARHRVATATRSGSEVVDFTVLPSTSAAHGLNDLATEIDAAVIVVGSAETEGYDRRVFAGSTASRLLSGAEHPVAVAPKGFGRRLAEKGGGIGTVGAGYIATSEAKHALTVAADVSARIGVPLELVTAVDDASSNVPWLLGEDEAHTYTTTAREGYQAALDDAARGLPGQVATRVLVGDVVAVLADATGIDLMFVGSRGYGPVRRVLLGGLSSRLMRRASMPVVVVPRPG